MGAPKTKKGAAERREPVFDVAPGEGTSRPKSDKPSRPRKRRGRKRGGSGRWTIGRIAYWGAVVGLWLFIAAIGGAVWVGAHLPPIQSLEIPKRPP
jgi:penicillin-binding protein 1A